MLDISRSLPTIEKTIRLSIVLISSMAIFAMAGLGWKLSSDAKQANYQKFSEISKQSVEMRLQQNINLLAFEIQQISNAALIANSLMDSYGREAYLQPFMEQKTASSGMNFALYDYRGRLIFRSGSQWTYIGPSQLAEFGAEKKDFDIRLVDRGHNLEFETPVLYIANSQPIGYLVGSLPVESLFADATLNASEFFHAEINLYVSHGKKIEAGRKALYSDSNLHLLSEIHLQPKSTDFPEEIRRLGVLGLFVTSIIFLVSILLGRITARMISAPVRQLAHAVMALREVREPALNMSSMPQEISHLASLVFSVFQERSAALKKLESLAHYDNLTSILSRARFDEDARTSLEVSLRSDGAVALIYIDLDFFKDINDRHGHGAGDIVLREVTQRMGDRLRTSDLLGRRGGDEFVILLRPCGSRDDVALLCWELATLISMPIKISDELDVRVGVSMGAAFFPFDADGYDELLTRADKAMYAAKNGGRGRLAFSSGEIVELEPSNWAPAAGTRN
jgi:diguanylate cyclase (GGDEF)-like protein